MTFRCPTADDVLDATLKLLPRGRAWQTAEGSPQPTSVLWQYWKSVADLFAYLSSRICALRLEFWCATHSETHDLWMQEYGLPDACDPFPDLCAKVAAIGGTRCDYYQFIAARAGWRLACVEAENQCGARVGHALAQSGCARPGQPRNNSVLHIVVYIANSPALTILHRFHLPKTGRQKAGQRLTCEGIAYDFSPLECLLARVIHAEILITYEAI